MKKEKVEVTGNWLIKAKRHDIYNIISNWEKMPENFPKIAKSMKVIERKDNNLKVEAIAASFGRLFPEVKINIDVELLPDRGYRCHTFNTSFNTTGEEELLLLDDPEGTIVKYTYFVTVKNQRWKKLFAWMVKTFGLPFWKRSFIDRLNILLSNK
jgi:hypothetical protein